MTQTRTVEQERAAFDRIMEANTARLMDFAKPYVGRLNNADRGTLLGSALTFMWERRKTHNPKAESLLQFWDRCLRAAAVLRKSWLVSKFDGWTWVRGAELGAQGV